MNTTDRGHTWLVVSRLRRGGVCMWTVPRRSLWGSGKNRWEQGPDGSGGDAGQRAEGDTLPGSEDWQCD